MFHCRRGFFFFGQWLNVQAVKWLQWNSHSGYPNLVTTLLFLKMTSVVTTGHRWSVKIRVLPIFPFIKKCAIIESQLTYIFFNKLVYVSFWNYVYFDDATICLNMSRSQFPPQTKRYKTCQFNKQVTSLLVNDPSLTATQSNRRILCCQCQFQTPSPGIILYIRPANERRRYIVTSSHIGWAHTQNDPRITSSF